MRSVRIGFRGCGTCALWICGIFGYVAFSVVAVVAFVLFSLILICWCLLRTCLFVSFVSFHVCCVVCLFGCLRGCASVCVRVFARLRVCMCACVRVQCFESLPVRMLQYLRASAFACLCFLAFVYVVGCVFVWPSAFLFVCFVRVCLFRL